MMQYRGVNIYLFEGKEVKVLGIDKDAGDYTVTNGNGLVFQATSEYGSSYATDAQTAYEGAQKQIDNAIGG